MATVRSMPRRGRRRLFPYLIALAVVLVILVGATGIYTDLLWFREVGFTEVFSKTIRARVMLFTVFGVAMALAVGLNIAIAHRLRPSFRPPSQEQISLDQFRVAVEPYLIPLVVVVALVIGVLTGLGASTRWATWLQWRNGQQFGIDDPQFGRDVSYFTFTYPFQRMVLSYAFGAVFVAFLTAAITHYLYGGVRLQSNSERVTAGARAHLSVLLGMFVLLKGIGYYLDQFGLAFSPRGIVNTGASYADVHAKLPALKILAVISIICAGLFIANIRQRGWVLPATGFGLLVLSSVVIGGIYPAVVQQFRVKPNELVREEPFIQRNITATRAAYGLDNVKLEPYAGTATLTAAQVAGDKGTIPNARLLDPNILQPAFEQLQQIRGYYGFPDVLDIDRYPIAGKTQSVIVGVREFDEDGLATSQRNWINKRLQFTHGYGVVMSSTTETESEGNPKFIVKDIPPTGPVALEQPRIYYGERAPTYSIVGTNQKEIDRPSEGSGTGVQAETTTYDGKGGVPVGSPLRRLLYAIRFGDRNLVLSGAITSKSKILYVRDPAQRVAKVAPYLTLDQDPYPVVLGGRVVWVVDGYTTTAGYPYSDLNSLREVTADATSRGARRSDVNYVRNAVKATVDAYDGTVTLYAWDDKDPLLRTWMKAFPGTVKPRSAMSTDLLAHVRFPEDLFKVQRELLAHYHVTDAKQFYSQEDFWEVPLDPAEAKADQPPYYLQMQLPGDSAPKFWVTSPMVARNRPNLAAFVAASSDPDTYGQFRVLQLPTNTTFPGPVQRLSLFKSNPAASRDLTLLGQQGSRTRFGNLLTLPIQGSLLYVQPIYVESATGAKIPELKKVLVGYRDKVGYGDSLADALAQVFGEGTTAEPTPQPGQDVDAEIAAALADALKAFADADAALRRGDLAGYAAANARAKAAVDRANRAQARKAGTTASPSPSASASPAAA